MVLNETFVRQVTTLTEQISNYKHKINNNAEAITKIKKQINDIDKKVNAISTDTGGGDGTFTNLTLTGVLTTTLITEDITPDGDGIKHVNPTTDGAIDLGFNLSSTNRKRFNSIHTKNIKANIYEVNTDLRFYASSLGETARLETESVDNGGVFKISTRAAASTDVLEKIRIDKDGGIGLWDTSMTPTPGPNFGQTGQVLTSQGVGNIVSWTTPGAALSLSDANAIHYTSYDGSTYTLAESTFASMNTTNESIDTKRINEYITDQGLIINNSLTVKNPIEWVEEQSIDAPVTDQWGNAICISGDGTRFIVGNWGSDSTGTDRGAVEIYKYDGSNWVKDGATVTDTTATGNNDHFGYSVAMNNDGSRFVVGSPEEDDGGTNVGATLVFSSDGAGNFTLLTKITGLTIHANDQEGRVVAISGDGNTIATSCYLADPNGTDSGIVRIFSVDPVDNTIWNQKGLTIEGVVAGDQFGFNLSLNSDGSILAVGANGVDSGGLSNVGQVAVFEYNSITSVWDQKGSTIIGDSANDRLSTVDLSSDGNKLIVGSPTNSSGSTNNMAKVFEWSGTDYVQKGSNITPGISGNFAASVGISDDGNTLIIGAYLYDISPFTNNGVVITYQYNSDTSDYEEKKRFYGDRTEGKLGQAVSISNDGSTAVASGEGLNGSVKGLVKVFKYGRITIDPYHININNGTISCNKIEGNTFDFGSILYTDPISKYIGIGTNNPSAPFHLVTQLDYDCALRLEASFGYQSIIEFNKGNSIKFTAGIDTSDNYIIKNSGNTNLFTIENNGGIITMGYDQSGTYISGNLIVNTTDFKQSTINELTISDNITDYSGVKWIQETQIENTNFTAAQMGFSIAGSSDLNYIIAGGYKAAPNETGMVRVFEYDLIANDGSYIQRGSDLVGAKISEEFGYSVAMSNDGNIVVVGEHVADISTSSSNQGRARVYEWDGINYIQKGSLNTMIGENNTDEFGTAVACSGNGLRIIVGAPRNDASGNDTGAAYVYEWDAVSGEHVQLGNKLVQTVTSNTGDYFGSSVDMNDAGTIVVVGAPRYNSGSYSDEGEAYVFEYNSSTSVWDQKGSTLRMDVATAGPNDQFGRACALSSDGLVVAVSAPLVGGGDNGEIWVWKWDPISTDWVKYGQEILIDNLDNDITVGGGWGGTDIALSAAGDILVVGIPRAHVQSNILPSSSQADAGAVRTFKYNISANDWYPYTPDVISGGMGQNQQFGSSVAISSSGNKIAVGEPFINSSRGSVWTFNAQTLTSSIKNVIFEDNKITSNILSTNQLYTQSINATGAADILNGQYQFVSGTSNLGNTLYINNNNNKVAIGTNANVGTAGGAALEIAGDIELDGKIYLNGSPGDTGAVITSQGTGADVIWQKPYFLKVKLTTNLDTNNSSPSSYVITGMTAQFSSPYDYNNSDWDATNNQWECPQTGIYRIFGRVNVMALNTNDTDTGDNIRGFSPEILLNGSVAVSAEWNVRLDNTLTDSAENDDIIQMSVSVQTILQLSAATPDTIKLAFSGHTSTSGAWNFYVQGSSADETFMCIERII